MVQLRVQIQGDDPQINQKIEEVLYSQQEPSSNDTQADPGDEVEDISKINSSDHETEGITSQSNI